MDSGEGGLSQSLVKLQPIARLNAIMVVTSKPALLQDRRDLDRPARQVRHGLDRREGLSACATATRARSRRCSTTSSAAAAAAARSTAPTNQIAPGAGVVAASSDAASSGGLHIGGARISRAARRRLAAERQRHRRRRSAPRATPRPTTVASRSGPFGAAAAVADAPGSAGAAAAAAAAAPAGKAMLPNVRITADAVNNTLLIYANQESYRIIEQTLRQLDRPQLQVSIDATIAEITLNENLSYGVQFFLKSKRCRRAAPTTARRR